MTLRTLMLSLTAKPASSGKPVNNASHNKMCNLKLQLTVIFKEALVCMSMLQEPSRQSVWDGVGKSDRLMLSAVIVP